MLIILPHLFSIILGNKNFIILKKETKFILNVLASSSSLTKRESLSILIAVKLINVIFLFFTFLNRLILVKSEKLNFSKSNFKYSIFFFFTCGLFLF